MLVIERQRVILEQVRRAGVLTVRDAAWTVGANEVTVRRDLMALASNGLITRTRGGAVLPRGFSREKVSNEQGTRPTPELVAIAIEAASLIASGDSIILGAGRATVALARELNDVENLTVVTNSLLVCEVLANAPAIELMLTGGSLRRTTMTLVGPSVEQSLHGFQATVAFLSGEGLTAQHGLSISDLTVATAERAIAAAGSRVVVLVERAKIGHPHLCQVVPSTSIEMLITGSGPADDELSRIAEAGVRVRIASTDCPPARP